LLARTHMQLGDQAKAEQWSQRLRELKEAKDQRVGLAAPASDPPRILEPFKPWETPAVAPPRPAERRP
jgi:hypothetical protein